MKFNAALLVALLSVGIAYPASAAHFDSAVTAFDFPSERSLGVTVGLIGPGVAYRQFLTPELGFQYGVNTFWLPGYGVVSTGGQVMLSPFHRDNTRFYVQGGVGVTLGGTGANSTLVTPGVGVGISQMWGPHTTAFADLTLLLPGSAGSAFSMYYPQVGYLFNF